VLNGAQLEQFVALKQAVQFDIEQGAHVPEGLAEGLAVRFEALTYVPIGQLRTQAPWTK